MKIVDKINIILFAGFGTIYPAILKGQDYQTVNSDRIAYFENSYGHIKCIQIDSAKFETDSILHPVSNIQRIDNGCYTPYGASWLSSKIILQANGCNLFFNLELDTIKINTEATLNESWVSYEIPDSIKIISTVISADTCNILGLLDSVKIIGFNLYDKNMILINHKLNDMTIKISKFHGLTRTLNFTSFPDYNFNGFYDGYLEEFNLIGLSNPKAGIQNLTWFEANDFQIGDEIHILNEFVSWGPGCSKDYSGKTINKYLDRKDFKDSIIYTIERIESINKISYGISSSEYYHDTIISRILPSPNFDKLPDEPFIIESTVYVNTMYRGVNVSKVIENEVLLFSNNDCWRELIEDGCISRDYFIKGLGGPYYACSGGIDCYSEMNNRPVYYKKINSTWGDPLIINDIPYKETRNKIMIYPNPSKDAIWINTTLAIEPFTFEISDLRGRVILKKEISNSKNSIKLEGISHGIYLYRITIKHEIETGKLVIE